MRSLVSLLDYTYWMVKKYTLTDAIFGEKSAGCHEINATTDHVSGGEGRSVCFSSALAAEGLPIISMVCPAFWFPAWKLFK